MPLQLRSKEELLIAAVATQRPVAFLVGAPLSLNGGVGVPGVTDMLEFVRQEVQDRAAFSLPLFETAITGKTGGDAYQEAMKWLGGVMGQDAINNVIKRSVLSARKPGSGELGAGTDGSPDDWHIPSGTTGLAELSARGGEKFLGPILTTNFDPLISLAIHKSGGHAVRQVLTGDVTLVGAAADNPGISPVVHLHGFWRDSDTLHTQAQLTNPRPRLAKSLQRLLQRRTLIVAAYGGWDDFFTKALVELMNDEQAPLDVIWCFYENDVDKVKERHGKLLAELEPAIVMNRFRAFGGIDCHGIFTEILTTSREIAPAAAVIASPLAGWELIDAAYLEALPPLRPEEVVRYFDGATPTWRHAACADIPSRLAVGEIARRIASVRDGTAGCSLQLIRAAGGEGKTTLLLQAGAAAATSKGWNVLWRPSPRIALPPEHILTLNPAKHWLIVADDGENLVRDLGEAARLLHAAGHSHVHFLLAARDTDWRYFDGDRQPWHTMLTQHQDITLRELRHEDANMLIGAWQKHGPDGLRKLASLPSTEKRVAALLNAVHDSAPVRDEGSFFGGLLAVRFGPDGLRNHVVSLLTRLKDERIENSHHTLFEALLYVAACHAVGMSGIDENVLADLVGVSRDWVQTLVVNPLGEEAAAVRSAGHVLTRHSEVAAAILVAAEQELGADIAEVWSAIVSQTVRTGRDVRMDRNWFARINHVGPRLQDGLPHQLAKQRRKDIAVAAAWAGVEAEPHRLSQIVNLGKTYRNGGDLAAAIKLFRDHQGDLTSKEDFRTDSRGYWNAWGTTEGEIGKTANQALANAWLGGLSISDFLTPAEITAKDIELACSSFGLAFGRLATPDVTCPYARARRVAAFLGWRTNPHPSTARHFRIHDREADKVHTPHPKTIEEAISWLTTAVAQAGRELQDPFLKALLEPDHVSFNILREFFTPTPPPRPRAKQNTPPPPPQKVAPVDDTKPLHLRSALTDKIQAGIERVITEAWAAVPPQAAAEDRFKLARKNAEVSVSRLSPYIKRDVRVYFHSEKWEPLKSRDPKA
ncbi:MAG: hypothetical protein QOI16_4598 [Pseudonocardiales bacterium]|jgi:hypothetical protein|nr:hypothetical protein [Pseudonocardiales bacterium]